MKVSEIRLENILQHARLEQDIPFLSLEERDDIHDEIALLEGIKDAAIGYVKSYTGLKDYEMDEYEELATAVLVLATDMYENRTMTVAGSRSANRLVDSILSMHRRNLL